MMKRKIILILPLLFLVACNQGKAEDISELPNARDISSIQVQHYEEGLVHEAFLIDFEEMSSSRYVLDPISDALHLELIEDYLFEYMTDLELERVDEFKVRVLQHRFDLWNGFYDNNCIEGGHSWSVTIQFSDGDVVRVAGFNHYPASWDEMQEAFIHLTDVDILTNRIQPFDFDESCLSWREMD